MAGPFNRDAREQSLAAALRRYFRDRRGAWIRQLERSGYRADRIPKRFLDDEAALMATLLLLANYQSASLSAAETLRNLSAGMAPDDVRKLKAAAAAVLQADAEKRARETAAGAVATTITLLQSGAAEVAAGRPFPERSLDSALGGSRAETIAITETTTSKSRGMSVIRAGLEDGGAETQVYWITERDDRVCPVCKPLDGTTEAVWGKRFPDGPPAHTRCRCDLRIDLVSLGQLARGR